MRSVFERTGDYERYADEIVFPERAGARVIVNAVEEDVRALAGTAARVSVLEVRVAPGAPVAGRRLEDVGLPEGSVVVTNVERDTIAGAGTVLDPGETYVVAAEPPVADEVRRLFRG
jgi:trk system potassium uptake protein TrkA